MVLTPTAVLYVHDLDRMRAFYQQCFGLTVEADDDDFCVLSTDGWELSLVRTPASLVITDPPRRRAGTPVKLSFPVESFEAVASAGALLDSPDTAWDFRGYRHLDCLDPEGNVVQLRLATAR